VSVTRGRGVEADGDRPAFEPWSARRRVDAPVYNVAFQDKSVDSSFCALLALGHAPLRWAGGWPFFQLPSMDNRTFRADDRLNQFSDSDDMWGPLLFLRPDRHQVMTPARVLTIAGLLGGFYGMLGNVMLGLMARGGSGGKPAVWMMPALLTAMYFLCAQISIVAAWNRRARLLSRQQSWSELTRRPATPPDDQQAAD
jgi:hypothetical protein